jgi:hypothetical protein
MRHLVMTRCAAAVMALAALAGCGRGSTATQVFTRQVPATPAAIVGSAVTTFSNHGIPVAVADEPGGKVRTAPVNLRGSLASRSPDDRVACPAPAGDTTGAADTAPVTVTFQITVKPVPDGSIVSLDARRENTSSRCVVKSAFVAQLLEEITQGARRS